ncbi:MAG: hypothetical protein HY447_03065 [Candidatus Omnitrophica bacterium]|nr:hypothetical protein [Candidatus Omnitrophota bacterium]
MEPETSYKKRDYRFFLFLAVAFIGFIGGLVNFLHLFERWYMWPVVRLMGYSSLLVYALFMLRRARYNTRNPLT